MSNQRLKNTWAKAQVVEEKLRRRKPPHESREWWGQNLSQEFHLDFAFFKGKAVLEVGCGPHGMIHYIDTASIRYGLDPLCCRYKDYFINGNSEVNHIAGVGENLPFRNNIFDMAVCYNVIDHGMSPLTTLKEISRVMKKDGSLLFSVSTFFNFPSALRARINLFDPPHPFHLSRKETRQFLQDVGFKINYHYYDSDLNYIFSDIKERRPYHSLQRLFGVLLGRATGYYLCTKV